MVLFYWPEQPLLKQLSAVSLDGSSPVDLLRVSS
jgi:hypothetical protein